MGRGLCPFNERQPLVSLPYHYRDSRTEKTYAEAIDHGGRKVIFAETGIQFMAINTLYHLIADVEDNSDVLAIADQFLTIADYLNYLFSGVPHVRRSVWPVRRRSTIHGPAIGRPS